jgi:TRAP-type C4-dicarboxylate transport system substrate-binding protein
MDDACLGAGFLLRACWLAALVLIGPAAAAQDVDGKVPPAKLSAAVGPAFALGKAGQRWAGLIAEKSDGRIPVQFFPGAVLASRDPAREFIALRDGAADLAVGSTLQWSTQVAALNAVGLPWLAPRDGDVETIASEPIAARLAAAVERAGAVPLAFAALGHRDLATAGRIVSSPEDLGGLRVRVTPSAPLIDLFVGFGAEPRAMSFAEAQAAWRAGALDGQEGTLATLAAARLDTLGVKHVLLWGAVAECAVFAANSQAWNRWTEAERAVVRDAALQAARELPALARAENDAARVELQKRGVQVTRLTATGRSAFAAAARSVYDKWAAIAGADLVHAAEAAIGATAR